MNWPAFLRLSRLPGFRTAVEACRRIWMERMSGWRAVAPAWPAAAGALAAIVAMGLTEQGREALLVTVDLNGGGETAQRYIVFLVALVLFCLGVMASALFVMAVEREEAGLEDDDRTARARRRVPPDPIHNSIELRTRVALAIGIATPLCLLLVLTTPFDAAGGGLFVAARVGAAALAGVFSVWLCGRLETLAIQGQRHWRASYARSRVADAESPVPRSSLGQAWDVARSFALRTVAAAFYFCATFLRILAIAPHRYGVGVIAAFAVLALTLEESLKQVTGFGVLADPSFWAFTGREGGALGVGAVTILVGLLFLVIRHRAMKVLELREGRRLVFDRVFQSGYRGLSLTVVIVLFAALWMPLAGYDSHRWIGPAALLLAGLSILVSFFIWLVRNAIETPVTVIRTIRPFWLWRPFNWLGRGVEWVQDRLHPILIVAIGLTLLAFDRITLPLLEHVTQGGWVAAAALIVLGVATIAAVNMLVRAWRDYFVGRDNPRVMRFASIMVLAPFILATLGENHQVASIARSEDAPLVGVRDHARTWLLTAAKRAGAGPADCASLAAEAGGAAPAGCDPPIMAVIVLAEGGGLRASSQAGQLLGLLEIEDAKTRVDGAPSLFDHVYAMSGVSGGAVGVATYLAARAERRCVSRMSSTDACATPSLDSAPAGASRLHGEIRDTLSRDHLSGLFGGMFASDVMTTILPLELPMRIQRLIDPDGLRPVWMADADARGVWDRADFFERGLSAAWAASGGGEDWFEQPLEHVARTASDTVPPVVLFGAFGADDGAMTAASNVAFDTCGDRFEAASSPGAEEPAGSDAALTGLVGLQRCFDGENRTLPLSTAAHLSARFPGSNPPGVLPRPVGAPGREGWSIRQVVDGGYYDNSGSASASFAVRALYDAAEALDRETQATSYRKRLRIVVLHILTVTEPDGTGETGEGGSFPEIMTPLGAVIQARKNSGRLPLDGFCRLVAFDAMKAEAGCDALLKQTPQALEAGRLPPLGDVTGDRGVYWISAPLVVSTDRGAGNYVLLGWMLKQNSHAEIGRQMSSIAKGVYDSVYAARADAAPPPPLASTAPAP